jgi:hypothetical protein
MIQNLVVALIVLAAIVYVVRKYLPASLRERLVYKLRKQGTQSSRLAEWIDVSSGCGSGSDGCNTCKSCAPADGVKPAAPTEHVIKIVRR